MREIKFRFWDKEIRKMIDCSHPHFVMQSFFDGKFEPFNLQNGCGKNTYDVMQYTGLKDKNGKEIYEGDIVKVDNLNFGYGKKDEKEWLLCEIAFEDFCFCLKNGLELYNYKSNIEVIGNIYENPELLNTTKV